LINDLLLVSPNASKDYIEVGIVVALGNIEGEAVAASGIQDKVENKEEDN
jgi:hypothetical protein